MPVTSSVSARPTAFRPLSTTTAAGATTQSSTPFSTDRANAYPLPTMGATTTAEISRRLRDLMGPFGAYFPHDEIRRGDIPFIEAGLNYELMQMAEQDRQQGISALQSGRSDIGNSTESQLAREIAARRAQELPFSKEIDQQRGALSNAAGLASQRALADAQAQFAQRGIGGGVPALALARAQQGAQAQAQQQLAEFSFQAAQAQEQAQRAALQDLMQIALEQELRRAAFDEAIANAYLDTERSPFDLSGLIEPPPHPNAPVGYKGDVERSGGSGNGGSGITTPMEYWVYRQLYG